MNLIESSKAMIDLWLVEAKSTNSSINLSKETIDWLTAYIEFYDKDNLTDKIIKELKPIRKPKKYKLYRGFAWSQESFAPWKRELKDSYPFKKGKTITMDNSEITGWTTNLKVAEEFAMGSTVAKYWIILEFTADKEIMCDMAAFPKKYTDLNHYEQEAEVLILPHISFKPKVLKIGYENKEVPIGWPEELMPPEKQKPKMAAMGKKMPGKMMNKKPLVKSK